MPYQDVWVRGQIQARGSRGCKARYRIIKTVAEKFQRPFSVLDLGANQGYFGFRLASDFKATVVMVDGQEDLIQNCIANDMPRVIGIKKRLTIEELETWSGSEHFDLVLCLNMLHHFKYDHRRAADAVLNFGEHVIIETPALNETNVYNADGAHDLLRYFKTMKRTKLGTAPSFASKEIIRPIYYFHRPKTRLTISYHKPSRKHEAKPNKHHIHSDFKRKYISIPIKKDTHDWIHGMNLQNFRVLGGGYPSKERLIPMIRKCVNYFNRDQGRHGDVRPWNFILLGHRVELIDHTDRRNVHQDDKGLVKTIKMIREMKR